MRPRARRPRSRRRDRTRSSTSASAGARTFESPSFVIGSEALYCDADNPAWVELRVAAEPRLVEAAVRAIPDAHVEPIGTSARVGGSSGCEIEAMEGFGVLRAACSPGSRRSRCASSRTRSVSPTGLAGGSTRRKRPSLRCCRADRRGRPCLSCRRRSRPPSGRSASSSARRSAPTARTSGARCRSECRSPSPTRSRSVQQRGGQVLVFLAVGPLVVAAYVWGAASSCRCGRR